MATSEPTKDIWTELRKPFPAGSVGKIPKGGMKLDYVGHAAVTDRLLTVDPAWTWEPLALDTTGLPALDDKGNLWIKLTVGGVTRLGVGDGNNMKERIGDALRNAAMRFGVALDLWSKDELESNIENPENKNQKPSEAAASAPAASAPATGGPGLIKPSSMEALRAALRAKDLSGDKATEYCQFIIDKPKPENEDDVTALLAALNTGAL